MCSEDIPRGLVALPSPERRRFLSTAGLVGGAATVAALSGCTVDSDSTADQLEENEEIIHHTYTGLSRHSRNLTLRGVIEASDAMAPNNQLRGAHRVIWDIGTAKPYVAITFDDGPDPRWTPQVLDALAAAGARATFFMMGHNVDAHRDLARRVVAEGHDIGNHTWSHQDLAFMDSAGTRSEITDGRRAIREVVGVDTTYFRPPRGELTGAAMRILAEGDDDTFLWSVSRNDPAVGTPGVIAGHVAERLRPGAIVDLHDSIGRGNFLPSNSRIVKQLTARRDVDVAAVPSILQQGKAAGLEFITISEMLAAATNPAAITPPTTEGEDLPKGPTTQVPRD